MPRLDNPLFITTEYLQKRTNQELLDLWNKITDIFDKKNNVTTNERSVAGLLQLSRETERRGLELKEGRLGKLLLIQKQKVSYDKV